MLYVDGVAGTLPCTLLDSASGGMQPIVEAITRVGFQ